jgi:hypothetical protein
MRLLAFTLLTAASCLAQAIDVPAGTKVGLRLTSPLATKTAQPGDAVHAEAAFPVTAANNVAIPPGTYVEGVIDQITRRGAHAGFTMHFTKMVFSNGYTVTLSAATAETRRAGLLPPADVPAGGMALQPSTAPTAPQPPSVGPNKDVFIGIGVGTAAAVTALAVIFGHRGGDVYMRAGWRFEMVLTDSLSLDAGKVADAVAHPTPR